ncbi:MAG: tetratricopeptide repeat protein [Bacteroidales bacterium]|nr:tetratricopeptide repeat protein [Bacteroidales bacterium]
MKKLIVTLLAMTLALASAYAQDMAKATETAKLANEALVNGDYDTAYTGFKEALSLASACGEEGEELVATCQNVLPSIVNAMARKAIRSKDYDMALSLLDQAVSLATEYGVDEEAVKAKELIPQAKMSKANDYLNDKKFAEAAALYREILEADATNGVVALRLGMALQSGGDLAGAEEAYKLAAENGQDVAANRQLGTMYLKKAASALKGKNYKEALVTAVKSAEVCATANAYKIAGTAANALGRKSEAIEYLSKYLEMSPSAGDAAQIQAAIDQLKTQK